MNIYIRTSAREDILRQYFYYLLEKDATRAAERFLQAAQSAIEALCRMPGAGAPKMLDHPRLAGLRSWPVRGFPAIRIYYIHAGEDLRIVRILHGKRDISPLLEEESSSDED
ncbi:MAG TPA: type II toxin-antitoxin system RelE/ParE family toxin [Terracidiphilus sp.]